MIGWNDKRSERVWRKADNFSFVSEKITIKLRPQATIIIERNYGRIDCLASHIRANNLNLNRIHTFRKYRAIWEHWRTRFVFFNYPIIDSIYIAVIVKRVTKQKFRVYLSHIRVSFFQVLDRYNSYTYIIKFLRIGLNETERDTVWSRCFAFFLRGKKGEARRAVIIVQTYNRGKGEKFKTGSLGWFNEITKKILLSM